MDVRIPNAGLKELPILAAPRAYVCPGEDHPIPRSIHLARLAAYYPKCRECEHRQDTGQLPRSTVGRLEQTAARVVQPSPFRAEGVRGEHLNHLTRQTAGRVAAALADRLWESRPLIARLRTSDDDIHDAPPACPHPAPVVVIGHDPRPSSPDLSVGIGATLRRMGCEVIDVGRVTAPCHAFAVEHLQADAGAFLTGSGFPWQWGGVDLVGPRGLPWSLAAADADSSSGTLLDIERRFLAGVSRPTREAGTLRYFDAAVPYRANLLKHFQNLRPLRVVCATSDAGLLQALTSVFDPLPCDLLSVAQEAVLGDSSAPPERLAKQIRRLVRETTAAFGVAIADDGRGVCLFDEVGRHADASRVLAGLAGLARQGRQVSLLVARDCSDVDATAAGVAFEKIGGGREGLVSRLYDPASGFGLEAGGRLWLKDPIPTCDAVLTLALLLRTLSSHQQPFSTLFAAA